MAGVGRSLRVIVRSVGTVQRAAKVESAPSSPMSRAGGWIPRGEIPQLDDRLLGPTVRAIDELTNLVQVDVVGVQLLHRHAETHGDGDQLGLGPIVEVPLDPPQGGGGRIDGLGAGMFESAHPARRGIGRQQCTHETAVDGHHGAHGPRSHKEHDHPGQ